MSSCGDEANGKNMEHEQRALEYANGAEMIANKVSEADNLGTADARSRIEIEQAIALNNKAVIFLKTGKVVDAMETARSAL